MTSSCLLPVCVGISLACLSTLLLLPPATTGNVLYCHQILQSSAFQCGLRTSGFPVIPQAFDTQIGTVKMHAPVLFLQRTLASMGCNSNLALDGY